MNQPPITTRVPTAKDAEHDPQKCVQQWKSESYGWEVVIYTGVTLGTPWLPMPPPYKKPEPVKKALQPIEIAHWYIANKIGDMIFIERFNDTHVLHGSNWVTVSELMDRRAIDRNGNEAKMWKEQV